MDSDTQRMESDTDKRVSHTKDGDRQRAEVRERERLRSLRQTDSEVSQTELWGPAKVLHW